MKCKYMFRSFVVPPADSGLSSGGASQSGRPDSGSGQRAAGQRERHPPGGAHLLQERDPTPAVGFLQSQAGPV